MLRILSKVIPSTASARPAVCSQRFLSQEIAAPTGQNDRTMASPPQPADGELDKLYSRLEVELRGYDPAVLKSDSWFATTAAEHLGVEVGRCFAPRKAQHDRLTLLKSVHIYKKHLVQYEIRTHFRFMHFHKLTGSTLDPMAAGSTYRNDPLITSGQELPNPLRHEGFISNSEF